MPSDDQDIELFHVGAPIIRAHAKPIKSSTQGAKICRLLTRKLRELQGAGLAAPQIGLPYRVFVIEVRKTELFPDREETPLYTVINPVVEFLSEKEVSDVEGCFSVPGYVGLVPRYWKLRMSWEDAEGEKKTEEFEGYLARVIQHELDHLNGLVYIDRMKDMKTFVTREHYQRSKLEDQCMTVRRVEENN